MYEIQFSTAAQKYFKKLRDKKLKNAFYEALHKISENPYIENFYEELKRMYKK